MPPESTTETPNRALPLEALETLRGVLQQQKERAPTDAVWLSAEATARLNQLGAQVRAFREGKSRPAVAVAPAPEPVPLPAKEPAPVEPKAEPRETVASPAVAPPPQEDKWMRLAAIRVRAERCPRCRGLGSLREKMVFAAGSPNARIMFVGEAPGAEEERRGEPFVGPAGALLDKIINAMGLQRSDVYISNIVKYRPMIDDGTRQGEANRKPTSEEMAASVAYVLEEIEVVDPAVVIALGGTAMEGLLNLAGSVSSQRGRLQDFRGRKVMITYHPAYLLRNPDPAEKRKVWDDMKTVMAHLGMPVPGK